MKNGNEDKYVDEDVIRRFLIEGKVKTHQIYEELISQVIGTKGHRIESRVEKKEIWVRWDQVRKNIGLAKKLNISEKEFKWRLLNDMLKIGNRKHWGGDPMTRNQCKIPIYDDKGSSSRCGEPENRRHVFSECSYSREKCHFLKETLSTLMSCKVSTTSLLHMDYVHDKVEIKRAALLLTTLGLRRIYLYREERLEEYVEQLEKEFNGKTAVNRTKNEELIISLLKEWG